MNPRVWRVFLWLPWGLALSLALAGVAWPFRPAPREASTTSPVAVLAGGANPRFERALAPRPFEFPRDHGAHLGFQSEWWYFSGVLESAAGELFGYQLTFFRRALDPDLRTSSSSWVANQAWLAHFALGDVAAGRFEYDERSQRGALGLAGSQTEPWRVWVADWEAHSASPTGWPLCLRAVSRDGVEIELELDGGRRVDQGDSGLSAKGPEPGQASHYYSWVGLETRGRVVCERGEFALRGRSWMDREWSTSALSVELAGWDWFALQLEGGDALMLYRLRRTDGSPDRFSGGSFSRADGSQESLACEDFTVDELVHWTSPANGAQYPARWKLTVPRLALELEVEPLLADQELRLGFAYWEGAVRAQGFDAGRATLGRGFVELVGYDVSSASAARAAR